MKCLLCFVILTLLYSCYSNNSPKEESYNLIANSITFETARKLEKKHNLQFVGFGGQMMYGVAMMSMSLKIDRPLQRDDARKLLMNCVTEYLAAINANERIRPYLKNYPFLPENVEVVICSFLEDGSDEVYEPFICLAASRHGKFEYKTDDENTKYKGYKSEYEETYQEAIQLINQSK